MKNLRLHDLLAKEYAHPLEGWDFSHLDGRMAETPLPWSYREMVKKRLETSSALLDMDTGGGEFLDSLDSLPPLVCATEGYEPNIPVARKRLESKGVTLVVSEDAKPLPLEDASFDLILNRHGSYDCREIGRLLKKKGIFMTQQVGGLNAMDLSLALGHLKAPDDWCLSRNVRDFRREHFRILEYGENMGTYRFFDIGAVVYYLKCIPWQIPGFSIEEYEDRLELMHEGIEKRGYMDFLCHRFYLVAER